MSWRSPKWIRPLPARPLKPKASEVLTGLLEQRREPPWTSYFVRWADVDNDQLGMSHFNWRAGRSNYTVLRMACFPYIKYHCTKGPERDLRLEDAFYRAVKVLNLGVPCLLYGMAASLLVTHREVVHVGYGRVYVYFLMKEQEGARF